MSKLYLRYLIAVAFAAFATGSQIVVLPWLAVGELQLPPQQLGWVQSLSLLPGVLMLLLGGAFADARQNRRYLPFLYAAIAIIHGLLALWLASSPLVLMVLLLYALLLGIITAFIQPLRDKLMPEFSAFSSHGLQLSVVQMTLVIYVLQALGVAWAGRIDSLGIEVVLLSQFTLLLLSALLMSGLLNKNTQGESPAEASSNQTEVYTPPTIKDGFKQVWSKGILRDLTLLMGFNGFMHIGVFVVALPLIARDVYFQGAAYFANLQLAFVVGGIAATLGLLKRGVVQHPGRSILFSFLYTGMLMLAIAAGPTQTGLIGLVFLWGVVAGVSASLGKAVLQQEAQDSHRGRVLSVYQLALFGMAPLGAMTCGYAVNLGGALQLFEIGGYLSLAVFAVYFFIPNLWNVEHTD